METITIKNSVLAGDKPVKTIVLGKKVSKSIALWPFQNEILIDHLSEYRLTLTESPTGSGKSSIMLSYATIASKRGKKVIIITPQCGINFNFRKYVINSRFCASGTNCDYVIPKGGIVREPEQRKTDALRRFLKNPSESIYVATYQAFKLAIDTDGIDVSNVVLLVDEVHHSDVHRERSYLGAILKRCAEKCHEVHCFTATDFRTNGGRPVPVEFHKYRRTLAQHYAEGYCPDFGIFVRFYYSPNRNEFEKLASGKNIGNPKALLEAYVDEYLQNPLPTYTEFFDIRKFWHKPRVLAFDSTMALSQSNTTSWQELCYLSLDAAKLSGSVLLTWNLVAGWHNCLYKSTMSDLYDNWIEMLDDLAEHNGISADFFKEGQITKRKKSSTPMLAGCCKLTLI